MLRRIALAGLIVMLVSLIDPLEGSVPAVVALLVVTVVAHRAHAREQRLLDIALACALVGFASLWGFSEVGGIGGDTGRSMWWVLTMIPLPVGWLLGLWAGFRVQRGLRPTTVA